MLQRAHRELRALREFFADCGSEIVVLCAAAASLILMKYHPARSWWMTNAVYFGAVPLVVIAAVLRRNPLEFGLGAGDAKRGALHAAIGCAGAAVVVLVASRLPSVGSFYARESLSLGSYVAARIVIIASLEFFFRGFLLFGLMRRFGAGAVAVQMLPFAALHAGKPEAEAFGCILSGLYLGYVAYRSNAIWPAFVIHLFANVLNVVVHAVPT
jgi:membrane protease YdiL (CAAX protease family)